MGGGRLSLDTHNEVEWMLLARNGVVTVVEVEAVLAFLSPGADHHVELVTGRGGSQEGPPAEAGLRGGGDMRVRQVLTLKL